MGRALAAIVALLVLCIGGLVAVVALSEEDDTQAVDNLLAEDITRAVATRRTVDLRRVAKKFPWDRVVIVSRGTPREKIDETLGFRWDGELIFGTGQLLLFVDGARVARFADYRGDGRFAVPAPIAEIARDDAVFDVRALIARPR